MIHQETNLLLVDKDTLLGDINNKINTVKLLIYKDYPEILKKLDFDNDAIYCNPLLYAFFRHKTIKTFEEKQETKIFEELLQGYFVDKEKTKLETLFNFDDIAYVPNVGYFRRNEQEKFASTFKLENSSIEILRTTSPVLQSILDIPESDLVWNDVFFEKNVKYLNNAIAFLKASVPQHFEFIEKCCSHIYLFKTDPQNSNSFASGNSLGMVFFNIYQDEYDEVFFIDDIAHQTGHVIMNNFLFEENSIYKIDRKQMVEEIIGIKDNRDVNVLLHALFTYYTTFLCYDACIKDGHFNEKQLKEAIGRIGFYQMKCTYDFNLLYKVVDKFGGIEMMLTEKGIAIVDLIEKQFDIINKKWSDQTNQLDFSNQDYNFNVKSFFSANY